jgi:hypothetical protein
MILENIIDSVKFIPFETILDSTGREIAEV